MTGCECTAAKKCAACLDKEQGETKAHERGESKNYERKEQLGLIVDKKLRAR